MTAPRGKTRARVRLDVFAADAVDGNLPVTCTPASGSLFRLGRTKVNVTNRGGCNSTPGTVSVIDSETGTVVATVTVGTCPRFLDRNRDTGLVYVPNAYTDRSVSVIQDDA